MISFSRPLLGSLPRRCLLTVAGLFLVTPALSQVKPPVEVIAFEAEVVQQPQTLRALGTLEASQSVALSANVTETIQAMHFSAGEQVTQNQLLIELNSAEERALLEEASALVEEARQQYQRVKEVVGRGSVTEALVDQRYREWQTAIAKRKVIEAQVADRRLYAPFAGQLGVSPYSVGALVTPGTQIVSLDDISQMKLDLLIPTRYLPFLSAGQAVELISSAYPDETFSGQIAAISPQLDPNVRMIQVQARIQNPEFKLKTHMLVEAQIALPPQTQLHIPNTALLMQGDHEFVYRLTPSSQAQWQQNGWYEAQKIEVKSGRIGPSRTEIRSGLEPGDLVVSQGVMRVDPKTPVKIKAMQDDAAQAQLLQTQSAPSAKAP